MKKILHWNSKNDRQLLIESLLADEVSVGTTDTVLGIFAPITLKGFDLLNTIKKRSKKPYIILFENKEKAESVLGIQIEKKVERLLNNCWPGPVTCIFKAPKNLPLYLRSINDTVAIRVPDHIYLQKLLKEMNGVFSTSANKAGQPIPQAIQDIDEEILQQSRYAICDNSCESKNISSTILDCTEEKIKVIREGAYPISVLEDIYGESFEKPLTK